MKYWYLLSSAIFIALATVACGGSEQNNMILAANLEEKELSRVFMRVIINNLRVRTTPDLEGAVLERLKEQIIVEYLHDSTNFTTMVEMNGKEHHDNWYKVKTDKGNEGWVYGGCIAFLEKIENDRILALKIDAETRLKNSGKNPSEEKITPIIQKRPSVNDVLIKRFDQFLTSTTIEDPSAMNRAISYYESSFIKDTEEDGTSDVAFVHLMQFYQRVYQYWKRKSNLKKYQFLAADIARYGTPNMQIDEFCRKLDAQFITFGRTTKGQVVLIPNIDKLMRSLFKVVSPTIRTYLEQIAMEAEQPVFEGDELVIELPKLATYTVFWDKYLVKHPYSPMKKELMAKRLSYLSTLLRGTTLQPAFDVKTSVLQSTFRDAYQLIETELGHSPLVEAIKNYHELLKKESYIQSKTILAAQEKVINNLK